MHSSKTNKIIGLIRICDRIHRSRHTYSNWSALIDRDPQDKPLLGGLEIYRNLPTTIVFEYNVVCLHLPWD